MHVNAVHDPRREPRRQAATVHAAAPSRANPPVPAARAAATLAARAPLVASDREKRKQKAFYLSQRQKQQYVNHKYTRSERVNMESDLRRHG